MRPQEYLEYQREFLDASPPVRFSMNPQLGFWVALQRKMYKAGTLSPHRYQRLQDVGFIWDLP